MLELDGLTKHFQSPDGEVVRAVDEVSLSVSAGEIVALYGPSGSGKTTLLKLVAALLPPDAGKVVVNGCEVSGLSGREAAAFRLTEVGLIRQTADFVPGASAIDNAAFKLLGRYRIKEARHRVEQLMGELGLGERLTHRGSQLSGGERQRVMIARALAIDPALVLADEPTGNLDSRRSEEVLRLLRRLSHERRTATILVTHDPLAARYADRVLELHDGRLRPHISSVASA
ncbi:ABC transporter ATP-binding protein [Conexibacter sp. JD483]|uniref:ABC transporter ATP-binding protein n=1 Tax=unclassified Conexibacter TaxID=2627773 RepID=UPI00272561F5|nr:MULTISPECIES: ABC transporter ATP-binding protein [unclassified Conexibacter]MDO8187279.1 ABC transporter ATP-binding protein [Conexibacter sp. CPCC 205706]MDO8198888.1 ABC transporter ATP-binding protein [Conexibacter sp. CPCC 205762]MDR9370627.1 ABC transporter ATP-binding protein [Conexibacter sp. JD483]